MTIQKGLIIAGLLVLAWLLILVLMGCEASIEDTNDELLQDICEGIEVDHWHSVESCVYDRFDGNWVLYECTGGPDGHKLETCDNRCYMESTDYGVFAECPDSEEEGYSHKYPIEHPLYDACYNDETGLSIADTKQRCKEGFIYECHGGRDGQLQEDCLGDCKTTTTWGLGDGPTIEVTCI